MAAAQSPRLLVSPASWLARVRITHIVVLSILARLLAFAVLPDQHFPDAGVYVESGRALATTGFMSTPIYMPLYPIWTWLWGGAWGVKFGDILLSTASVWLIWCLALLLVKDRVAALTAACAAAVYPHFIFYAVSGLTETLFSFFLLACFVCFYRQRFAYASVLLVLTILVRPTLDLLAPVLVATFALVVHRMSARQTACRLGQYACIYVALMSPWWVDNYLHYGTFVRLDLGDGIVLYSGNNPLNASGGGVIGGAKGTDVDMGPFSSIADPVKRNAALEHAAWQFIEQNPGRFLELAGIKFIRFWRLWPYAAEYEQPWVVAASLLSYGVMLVFAIAYVVHDGRRHLRLLSPILLLTAYLTLVHMATIGSIRYRFPLEPFIVILATAELMMLARAIWPADADRSLSRREAG